MPFFAQIPLLRLLLPFIGGIIIFVFAPRFSNHTFLITLLLCFSLALNFFLTFFSPVYTAYRYRWIYGACLNVTFFLAGYLLTYHSTEKYKPGHVSELPDGEYIFAGDLTSMPVMKTRSVKTEIRVFSMFTGNSWQSVHGKLIAYLRIDTLSTRLQYGDRLIFSSHITEIPPPGNPSEFNYKRYLSFHNIFQRTFIEKGSWKKTDEKRGNFFVYHASLVRHDLLGILQTLDLTKNEYAVASALLLGYEEDIEPSLTRAYAASGALHVLSVSGLHVGIIYVALEWLLGFISKFRYGKISKTILIILMLWCYAGITGFSPSVLRATTMLSFVVVGRNFRKQSDVFNSIAVSAFLLLFLDPYLIFQVGFQLSYIAVLGIVLFYPYFYPLWEPRSRFWDKVWGITVISVSAQLATFPLGLLYFHQFPNYFIFSNLLVIPLSTAIIFLGIAILAISPIHSIAAFLSLILQYLLKFLNGSVLLIENLPLSLTEGISISIFESWLIYFIVIMLFCFFLYRQYRFLLLTIGSVLAFSTLQIPQVIADSRQKQFIIYNIPGTPAYNFVSGTKNLFIADTSLTRDKSRMLFYILHDWWDRNLQNTVISGFTAPAGMNDVLVARLPFIRFHALTVAFIHAAPEKRLPDHKPAVDILILGKNANISLKRLRELYTFKKLIFDSSNSTWKIKRWQKEAGEMNIEYYSVPEKGAYVLDIG
ncbi:MAG: ComEC family competence protein [Bacteroidetes bacterium]|nr:ComEC family competence protein [Bacteroidota bacterium]